ncbi:MAG: nitroreductase [Flavobacteriales bacterium]|jgi:nitroreductase/dihydropteridine reductase
MSLKENLKWRYAVKLFDSAYKVTSADITYLQSCIQLSASSYGLQPYKILRIQNSEVRAILRPASWNQPQITDASELFVFCNYASVQDAHIDKMAKAKGEKQGMDAAKIEGYTHFMKSKIGALSADEQNNWTAKQAYIALGNALAACAELGLDSCPIEGFERSEYNRILQLDEKGLNACVILAVGKRSEADLTSKAPKYRKETKALFEVCD